MVSETSQILFRHQINSMVPTLSFEELHIHLPVPGVTHFHPAVHATGCRLPHRLRSLSLIMSMWMKARAWAAVPSCKIPQMPLTGISSVMKFKCKRFWWFSQLGFHRGEESSLNPGMLVHSLFLISAQHAVSQAAHFLQQILLSFHFENTVHPNALK